MDRYIFISFEKFPENISSQIQHYVDKCKVNLWYTRNQLILNWYPMDLSSLSILIWDLQIEFDFMVAESEIINPMSY